MRKKSVLKFLKITACTLLSIVFILGVVAVPFYYSVIALTEPETVAIVIQEVDYKTVIHKNPAIKKTLAKYNITPTKADKIMKSKQTGELVEIYADEVTQIFLDIPKEQKLNASFLKQLIEDNTDKFLDIAEDNTNIKFNREKTKQEVDDFIEKNEVVIEESVSVIEEVRDVVKTIYTSHILEKKLSFWIAIALIISAFAFIAVIIILMHSNGFLWIGIDFAIISILLGLIIAFCSSNFISTLALKISDFGTHIIESAITISTEKMIIAVFSTVIMTMLFMAFFTVVKLLKRKYQKELPQQA
ncbi:MAG: hypothetical protein E7565_02900 [Ruminococcaceae bacterium]|nr:hypothetical protein [Oscillospiraceae bacterium]